jgi:NTE family protein
MPFRHPAEFVTADGDGQSRGNMTQPTESQKLGSPATGVLQTSTVAVQNVHAPFPARVWDRTPAPRHIGLALGGGAARGPAHIGVLQVLLDAQIPINMIAGCSAGAIVGALFAAGISPWRQEELVRDMHWSSISTLSLFDFRNLPTSLLGLPQGLFDMDKLIKWMDKVLDGPRHFDELQIPFAAIATDIVTGEAVIMNDGEVAPAVRASCTVPGIFTPYKRRGRLLVDGGVIANLPVQVVREMGAEYVIAVDLLPPPRENDIVPENMLAISLTSLYALIRVNQDYSNVANCTITPPIGAFSLVDMSASDALIAAGRAAAEAALPSILAALHQDPVSAQ